MHFLTGFSGICIGLLRHLLSNLIFFFDIILLSGTETIVEVMVRPTTGNQPILATFRKPGCTCPVHTYLFLILSENSLVSQNVSSLPCQSSPKSYKTFY